MWAPTPEPASLGFLYGAFLPRDGEEALVSKSFLYGLVRWRSGKRHFPPSLMTMNLIPGTHMVEEGN